ncbi:MAG: hypothetical protein SV760_08525 [Halobacteria archaeon]|nr:hypothetical protein [Halobacteria archaeon]
MKTEIDTPLRKTLVITGTALVIATVLSTFLPSMLLPLDGTPPSDAAEFLEFLVQVKFFISSFNLILLFVLLTKYIRIYWDFKNPFTLSLILFTMALFFYAMTSNPVLPLLFGFRPAGVGPFTFLPDFFSSIAIVILLYQSFK